MGQYFEWYCHETYEFISCEMFGCGKKWLEQFYNSGLMYKALMILTTDTSSLGKGGGDLNLEKMKPEFITFINPVLGRWVNKRITFSGDYSQEVDKRGYRDVSIIVKYAIIAIIYQEFIDSSCNKNDSTTSVKTYLYNKYPGINWRRDEVLQTVINSVNYEKDS